MQPGGGNFQTGHSSQLKMVRESSDNGKLLLLLDLLDLLSGSHHVDVLDTHDTTTPFLAEALVVVELVLELLGHGVKVSVVLLADISNSNACGSLQMAKFPEIAFSTDEAEWNSLLSAESGEEDDHLDWVNVVSDDDKLGFVLFDEGCHVVEAELEVDWFGGLAVAIVLGFFLQTLLFIFSVFGAVFGQQFKEFGSLVLIDSGAELVDGGGHLQPLHQDPLLSLDSDVLRPLDHTGEVSLRLDVTSESEVSGSLLEEGTLATSSSSGVAAFGLNNFLTLYSFLHHND